MGEKTNGEKIFACKLTTPDLQKRKVEVIASLKAKVLKREELSNGYAYQMTASDENIDEVTSFIKTERTCCSFFIFTITVEEESLWLEITGDEGVKEFITDEIGL